MFGKALSSSILVYLWYEVDYATCTLLRSAPECSMMFHVVFSLAQMLALSKQAHDCQWMFENALMGGIWKVQLYWHSWEWTSSVFWVISGFQGQTLSTEYAVWREKCNGACAGGKALSRVWDFNMLLGLLKTCKPVRAVCCTTLAAP